VKVVSHSMSNIRLVNESCVEQNVDAIVNAANRYLMSGGGVCGAIFRKAGYKELNEACSKFDLPLKDGDAVITPAFDIENAKYIIHAVGPDFGCTPDAFNELFDAYFNSLKLLKEYDLHSIAFPLISSGIFGGSLENAVAESVKQCIKAYRRFVEINDKYEINVYVCAFTVNEMIEADKVFEYEGVSI